MKIRRDVASVRLRSAKETWDVIAELISGSGTLDGDQLEDARSVMECVIADEQPATVPIVLKLFLGIGRGVPTAIGRSVP